MKILVLGGLLLLFCFKKVFYLRKYIVSGLVVVGVVVEGGRRLGSYFLVWGYVLTGLCLGQKELV